MNNLYEFGVCTLQNESFDAIGFLEFSLFLGVDKEITDKPQHEGLMLYIAIKANYDYENYVITDAYIQPYNMSLLLKNKLNTSQFLYSNSVSNLKLSFKDIYLKEIKRLFKSLKSLRSTLNHLDLNLDEIENCFNPHYFNIDDLLDDDDFKHLEKKLSNIKLKNALEDKCPMPKKSQKTPKI